MKVVVQIEPDQAELTINELKEGDFILDKETYCFFRDEIFIKDMEKFVEKVAPGKLQETETLEGAEKVNKWYDNQDLINKYYPAYNKGRQRFYLYKNGVYVFEFLGFLNITNEIQLIKLEMREVVNLLNELAERPLAKLLRKIGIAKPAAQG